MGTLSIVVPDPQVVLRLTEALSDRFRLVHRRSWREMRKRVRTARPQAVIVDPYFEAGPPTIDAMVEDSRREEFGLVVCANFQDRERELYQLGHAGVTSVLMAPNLGSRIEINQAVERAIATSVANAVVDRLVDRAPPLALDAIHWAVGHATQGKTTRDLAVGLSATPKALRNQLRKNNLPPARRTMLWGRLLYAAWALYKGDENIEELARRLGYATRSGLTKALSEAVGAPPTQLAEGDARLPVVEAYLHEIRVA